jgi:hypothetical protein
MSANVCVTIVQIVSENHFWAYYDISNIKVLNKDWEEVDEQKSFK